MFNTKMDLKCLQINLKGIYQIQVKYKLSHKEGVEAKVCWCLKS